MSLYDRGKAFYKYEIEVLESGISKKLKLDAEQIFAKNIHKKGDRLHGSEWIYLRELSQLHRMMSFLKQFKYVYLATDSIKPFVEEVKIEWNAKYSDFWHVLDPRIIYYIESTIKPQRKKVGEEKKDPDDFYIAARDSMPKPIFNKVFVEVRHFNVVDSRIFIELNANELPEVKVTHLPIGNNDSWELRPISEVIAKDFYPESLISLFAPGKEEKQKVDPDIADILTKAE